MIVQRLFIHDSVGSAALVLSWFTLFYIVFVFIQKQKFIFWVVAFNQLYSIFNLNK